MVVVSQYPPPDRLTVLEPSVYTSQNISVPVYKDRSDDVAWMLGCTLLIFTMQVQHLFFSSHQV